MAKAIGGSQYLLNGEKHYNRHKHRYIDAVSRRRKEKITWLGAEKDKPCADCKNRFPAECMDFDHVRGEKEFSICRGWWKGIGWERLKKEVAKCEVVCANCHRIRTKKRRIGVSGNTSVFQTEITSSNLVSDSLAPSSSG